MPVRIRPKHSTVPMAVLMKSTNSSTLYRTPYTVASCGDVRRGGGGALARGLGRRSRGRIESETAGGAGRATVTSQVDEPRASDQSALVHDRLIVSISTFHINSIRNTNHHP